MLRSWILCRLSSSYLLLLGSLIILSSTARQGLAGERLSISALPDESPARFVREYWMPEDHHAMRVNAPTASSGPFRDRWEVKNEDGIAPVFLPEETGLYNQASLYMELWGGHPGVANKRFVLNGLTTTTIPEHGSARSHCVYSYPEIPLPMEDLRLATNTLAFTCDKGSAFWGHYLIDQAAIRLTARRDHPVLQAEALQHFGATVLASPHPESEALLLELRTHPAFLSRIASVAFWGYYLGFDENGNGKNQDWHGYTKGRLTTGTIALRHEPPYTALWDMTMIPDQTRPIQIKAQIRFRDLPDWYAETKPITIGSIPNRNNVRVRLLEMAYMPAPFWVRDHKYQVGLFNLSGINHKNITRALLHVSIWDGDGSSQAQHPFMLNSHPIGIKGPGHYDKLHQTRAVPPEVFRKGDNAVTIHSTTHHHGLEILLPGPVLILRESIPR